MKSLALIAIAFGTFFIAQAVAPHRDLSDCKLRGYVVALNEERLVFMFGDMSQSFQFDVEDEPMVIALLTSALLQHTPVVLDLDGLTVVKARWP